MDIPRQGVAQKRRARFAVILVLILGTASFATWRVSKLEPAVPSVEFSSLWPDVVKRGAIVLDVKGIGTLVPEEIVWIPATAQGQVSKVMRKSGEKVNKDTVLAILTNPDIDLEANDLEWQVKQAEANYADLRVRLQSQRYDLEASARRTETAMEQAELTMSKKQQLFNMQLEPELNLKDAVANWKQAKNTYEALRVYGWKPEQARSVLPLATKTELVMTANPREWRHVFALRCDKSAHPQMREVMVPLRDEFARRWPALFADV